LLEAGKLVALQANASRLAAGTSAGDKHGSFFQFLLIVKE